MTISVLAKAIVRVEETMNKTLEKLKKESNTFNRLALVKEIEIQANTLIALTKEYSKQSIRKGK